jgi:hypothetical protein
MHCRTALFTPGTRIGTRTGKSIGGTLEAVFTKGCSAPALQVPFESASESPAISSLQNGPFVNILGHHENRNLRTSL